jgi:hypothetical protein
MSTTVTTQAELDAALAAKAAVIYIESSAGVWLRVGARGSSRVVARDSSRVEAWDSSSVVARGSSRVVARGSSRVVARDSSSVEAWDSSSVVAWDSSSVVALGSSSVVARDSSSVVARDSSSVVARDSSSVVGRDSSSVVAWDSSSVVAWDSSRVVARDSSSVVASPYVAIHLHSARASLKGGVVIDLTKVDLGDPVQWLEFHGVKVTKAGYVTLYKAVLDDYTTGRGPQWTYRPGATVTAEDFKPTQACGAGLHFGVGPSHAAAYLQDAKRFVAVKVKAADIVPLDDKCKAPKCKVLHEVDRFGERVQS